MIKPQNLHDVVGMAKLIEDKCHAACAPVGRSQFQRRTVTLPPPPRPRPVSLPIKLLTASEMAARREKGLCFNCDSKFTPGHKYTLALFPCLMVDEDSLELPEGDNPPEHHDPQLQAIPDDNIRYKDSVYFIPCSHGTGGSLHPEDCLVNQLEECHHSHG